MISVSSVYVLWCEKKFCSGLIIVFCRLCGGCVDILGFGDYSVVMMFNVMSFVISRYMLF